ncbi:MAG: hypothetical protein QOJ60_64 [Actinomycetota bacterium]|jgi:hypothetical protein|nr:hypothetical protein [Actinomycetota bacterium]
MTAPPGSPAPSDHGPWGLDLLRGGRHRRPEPPSVVHLVFSDGTEVVLAAGSSLARSMGLVAGLAAATA